MQDQIPSNVSTIHRLLGMRSDGHSFRFNANHQLNADIIFLDEVSMIDLAMFSRILDALNRDTRLVLLGDPHQLSSVDNGAVLQDLCSLNEGSLAYDEDFVEQLKQCTRIDIDLSKIPSRTTDRHSLTNAFCHLSKSYRFSDQAGIGGLARAIRKGELTSYANSESTFYHDEYDEKSILKAMNDFYAPYLDLCKTDADAEAMFTEFERCRVLAPAREGPYGINQLNLTYEENVNRKTNGNSHKNSNGDVNKSSDNSSFYHGKPLIISKNDYNLNLFNGDVGICVLADGEMKVAFRDVDGTINFYLASRLPQFETCYAMTIHKSQGSEFNRVMVILPKDKAGVEDLLNQALIYTAITRAKDSVEIYATNDILRFAVENFSRRQSGLKSFFNVTPIEVEQLSLF